MKGGLEAYLAEMESTDWSTCERRESIITHLREKLIVEIESNGFKVS